MGIAEEMAVSILEERYAKSFQAARAVEPTDPKRAALLYEEAASWAERIAGMTTGAARLKALERVRRLRGHAEALRAGRTAAPKAQGKESSAAPTSSENGEVDHASDADRFITKVNVSWRDIAGLEDTKRVLREAVAFAVASLPDGVVMEPQAGILLYGPPGTGKTMLASAACGSLGATFFNVPLSEIENKYFGESPKILRGVFEAARAKAPAIILLDDVDTIVTSRGDDKAHGASRAILGTLLTEMDGIHTKGKGSRPLVLVLASTNEPWSLDGALLSRFNRSVYVPLPDAATRRSILQKQLTERGFALEPSLDDLVQRTERYSGRELRNLCQAMVNRMLSDANLDLLGDGQGVDQFRGRQLKVAPIRREQVEYALQRVRSGVDDATIQRLEGWRRA
jgi:katanin p60 ATPase-containing subunit A1